MLNNMPLKAVDALGVVTRPPVKKPVVFSPKKRGHSLIPAPLIQKLSRFLFSAFLENYSYSDLNQIVQEGGYQAGEDFTFNYLDLEHTPEQFFENMVKVCADKGIEGLKISNIGDLPCKLEVFFTPLPGCERCIREESALQCGFLSGFLQGIVETYTCCRYSAELCCNTGKGDSCQCCCKLRAVNFEA